MKSYKQLITGIVIGSVLTGSLAFAGNLRTFTATEADFPVVVDGKAVSLDMPVVTIEDRTYLPLRAIRDVLGVSVDWDGKQAVVTTEVTTEPSVTPAPESTSLPISTPDLNGVQYTSDGLAISFDNDIPFISTIQIEKELERRGHKYEYNFDTANLCDDDGNIIIANIPFHNSSFIPLDFYYEKISPWLTTIQPK